MSQPDDDDSPTESTIWYLELTERGDAPAVAPPNPDVEIVRAELASPAFGRFLYTAVGGDHFWVDRLPWTWGEWEEWLGQPGLENWVAWLRGNPVGYTELHADAGGDGDVEISSFGIMPAFRGVGLGRHLLSVTLQKAWTIAERWPGLPPARRLWLHTCSFDSPAAMRTYRSQGLRVYDEETVEVALPREPPGPWPGALR